MDYIFQSIDDPLATQNNKYSRQIESKGAAASKLIPICCSKQCPYTSITVGAGLALPDFVKSNLLLKQAY
jgi:hypothetical protein